MTSTLAIINRTLEHIARIEALLAQCERESGYTLPLEKSPSRELVGHSGSLPATDSTNEGLE